jgi:hypothetical protein
MTSGMAPMAMNTEPIRTNAGTKLRRPDRLCVLPLRAKASGLWKLEWETGVKHAEVVTAP